MPYQSKSTLTRLLASGVIMAGSLHAQVITATLFGTVTDKTGAILPGASVTAANVNTGLTKTVVANDAGEYRLEFLPVGEYKVDVSARGFGNSEQTGITLGVNQNVKIDASLSPGDLAEKIEVTGAAPIMNTGNSEVGTTVENVQVTELPIVNRNVYSLLNIIPGVQQNSNQAGLGLPEQHTSFNGGIEAGYSGSVNYFLDGGENVTSLRNAGNILPNPDAIQEFRVQADNYSAEYGRFPSGVINVITKSGSNTVHGSVFEFWRNDELNAKNWLSTTGKTPLHHNQYGATLGGPIWHDRTFFFGSYAGLRENTAAFITGTIVPTPLERNADGNGYNFNTPSGGKVPTDPFNVVAGVAQPFTCNGVVNVICASRVDPVAVNLIKAWVPNGNLSSNRYQGQVLTPTNTDDFLLKLDHKMGFQQFSGSYFNTSGNSLINAGSSQVPYARIQYSWRQENYNVSDTMTLSPRIVNQTWATYTKAFGARTEVPALSLADYGSAWVPLGPHTLPNIGITGYFNLGDQISGPKAGTNFYSVRDLVSMSLSKHNFRFGGEVSLNKDAQYTNLNNYGNFSFNAGITGNGLADFLLGIPASVGQDQPVRPSTNTFVYSLFAQDDYRVTPRLTLNLGLRYDYQTVPTDPANYQDTYVAGRTSTVRPGLATGLLFIGDAGVKRGIASAGPFHLSPRFGFAVDVFGNGKTAIRGGVGMFWGGVSGNGWNQPSNFQPFTISLAFPNANSLTGATLSNPYRNYPGGFPFPYLGTSITPGSSVKTIDLNYHWPYTYQMNMSVQQQVTKTVALTVAYVGSLGRAIPFLVDLNYPKFYAPGTGPVTATGATCTTAVQATCGSSSNAANILARRPNPALGQVQQMFSNISSNYHGLQVVVEKRLTQGLSLTSSYVYSKTLVGAGVQTTSLTAQDYNNPNAEYGRADTDARQIFSTGAVWQIDYLRRSNALVRGLVNGWQISPIFRMNSGLPLNITNGLDANMDGNGTDRAALVGDYHPAVKGRYSWFNPAAFKTNPVSATTPNAAAVDGTTPRDFISAPGLIQLDLGLARSYKFFERATVEFRGEATNSLNHVNYNSPGTSANGSNFGVVTSAAAMRQIQVGARVTF